MKNLNINREYHRLVGMMGFIETCGEHGYITERKYTIYNIIHIQAMGVFESCNLITNITTTNNGSGCGGGIVYTFQLTEQFMALHEFEKL